MRAKSPQERVRPVKLTADELAWCERVGLDADLLQQAHARLVIDGKPSSPIRRAVEVQKMRGVL